MMKSPLLSKFLLFVVFSLTLFLFIQLSRDFDLSIDLTEEKRHTLSSSAKLVIAEIKEPINIECYLAGELPTGFLRFQKAIEGILERISIESQNQVSFSFVDPSQAKSTKARNEFYRSLMEMGLQPTNLTFKEQGKKSEKLIFPGAVLSYRGKEIPLPLLKSSRSASPEQMLNESIEHLEYEFISGIQSIMEMERRRVAFITGHHEPDTSLLAGFTNSILSKYDLYKVDLSQRKQGLARYDVVIIGKPTTAFSTYEKYQIDQYVMNGGSLLIFVDAMSVKMQEASGPGTIAFPYELNLEDLLFRYGVRINRDYVVDYQSGSFPVVNGNVGNQSRVQLLQWPFFPVISNYGAHPLVKGLDALELKFVSTLDTVKAVGIKKTPLLLTSKYTKLLKPPIQVKFEDWAQEIQPQYFRSGPKVVGYLLEGEFSSVFKNRILPGTVDRSLFKPQGSAAKIIVVGDGDFIKNDFNPRTGEPLPLGVDPLANTTYSNEEFILRALSYMTDETGLTMIRNKEIKIRPLDRVRIKEEKPYWMLINTLFPVAIVIFLGVVKWIVRRKWNTTG